MSTNKYQTVVQGEASETDSEDENYLGTMHPAMSSSITGMTIPGEASETDDDEEDVVQSHNKLTPVPADKDLPPLIVIRNDEARSPVATEEKPALNIQHHRRYSTLLQQKLLESNARLHHDVTSTIKHVYQTATKEVRSITNQLNNSQSGIISASHSIRLVLDDLKTVADKIDIITSCNLLPDIRM
ncbi:biogenesis of lysosome-related organelles complex 1 subunit 3-like [Ambystoma mexicanum]|uniref:biogenesis of lysosome-related organelles complex 1 subunit 3-like n=1 Tax=Ambystoma mexicanum TaxID=8296 RepID=UPI0037E852E5